MRRAAIAVAAAGVPSSYEAMLDLPLTLPLTPNPNPNRRAE